MTAVSTRVSPKPARAQVLHPNGTKPASAALRERACAVARSVTDPELPMLTLDDLGVLRDVEVDEDGRVVVSITPTYSGCPAMATMRDDLVRALQEAGLEARVRVVLSPPWTSDWISDRGRAARRVPNSPKAAAASAETRAIRPTTAESRPWRSSVDKPRRPGGSCPG